MNSKGDKCDVIYCPEDDENRVYCEICDKLCIERFQKLHLKSRTHINNIISKNSTEINMELLCPICNRSIIENESEFNHYLATLRYRYDKSFYENYIINNIILDEFDKILIDYITIHNKKT